MIFQAPFIISMPSPNVAAVPQDQITRFPSEREGLIAWRIRPNPFSQFPVDQGTSTPSAGAFPAMCELDGRQLIIDGPDWRNEMGNTLRILLDGVGRAAAYGGQTLATPKFLRTAWLLEWATDERDLLIEAQDRIGMGAYYSFEFLLIGGSQTGEAILEPGRTMVTVQNLGPNPIWVAIVGYFNDTTTYNVKANGTEVLPGQEAVWPAVPPGMLLQMECDTTQLAGAGTRVEFVTRP